MNKTININLANLFFHIDEEAYAKLKHYLEAVKRSFANTNGSDEIIADIEARIAELFHEKMENERQVITQKEVDEVIVIMGQPEDYMVDEDIFEDGPKSAPKATARVKKLYRDMDNKYIGGVSSGLGHYFGIEALWIRLIWILLTIFSWGGFVFIYILLWILIPEAVTTAQKLAMGGETINISNIEKKVKEGFEDVAEKVKNVDYEKVGNQVKSGSKNFLNSIADITRSLFNVVADIIMFFFKIIGKFIGIILVVTGATGIVGLLVGFFTMGILDVVRIPGVDFYYLVNSTTVPVWSVSLLIFFAIGIPFFFLMYLGLKILVNNLKSIGNIAKFTLLGMWIISLILLTVFGIHQAAAQAYSGNVTLENTLTFERSDLPININFRSFNFDDKGNNIGFNDVILDYTEEGEEILVSGDVRLIMKTSNDSLVHIEIRKNANGSSLKNATEIAEKIDYSYSVLGNTLFLDEFLTTAKENKFRGQEVKSYLYLPKGTVIKYENTPRRCWMWGTDNNSNLNGCEIMKYVWEMGTNGKLICRDCPEKDMDRSDEKENGKVIINKEGVDIDIKDGDDSFKVKIDGEGIRVKTNKGSNGGAVTDTVR